MPELPEVETIRCGIANTVVGEVIKNVVIRNFKLRWPIPKNLPQKLINQTITAVNRRGKYLLLIFNNGTLIIHLGMSGSLYVVGAGLKHNHVDFVFENGKILHFNDPRKFGCILWTETDPLQHKLLKDLGPEPIGCRGGFETRPYMNGEYLYNKSRNKTRPIKSFIMDSHIVVGIGNIYANEALFAAKINPQCPAGEISLSQYKTLTMHIKNILKHAIAYGGTTVRDFINSDGKPGYFKQELKVYGHGNQPCFNCGNKLREIRLGQRTTVYCPKCQSTPAPPPDAQIR